MRRFFFSSPELFKSFRRFTLLLEGRIKLFYSIILLGKFYRVWRPKLGKEFIPRLFCKIYVCTQYINFLFQLMEFLFIYGIILVYLLFANFSNFTYINRVSRGMVQMPSSLILKYFWLLFF